MKQVIARILILFCSFSRRSVGNSSAAEWTATDDRSDFNEATFLKYGRSGWYAGKQDVWICPAYAGGFRQRQCNTTGYF